MRRLFYILLGLILLGGILSACSLINGSTISSSSAGGDDLRVTDIWARPGQADGSTAIYMTIDNRRNQEDTLLSASCDAAGMTELHLSQMDAEGTMSMIHQENVPVPAGEKVEFKPGGLHVMLMGLKNDVNPGDSINCTLDFELAGAVQIEAPAREP